MRNVITEKNEPWRDLVNEGHVWQERLNDSNKTGLILTTIIISFFIIMTYRPEGIASGFDKFLAAPIHYTTSDTSATEYQVFGEASFKIADDVDYKKVTTDKGLRKFVAAQIKSLNNTGKLISQFPYGELKASQTFDDPDKMNIKTASDGSIFIGGILKFESYRTYRLVPWLGVFHKKKDGNWELRELVNRIGIDAAPFNQVWIAPLINKTFFTGKGE